MQAGDNKSYDDINVTPMVDLYLVLLLIFISRFLLIHAVHTLAAFLA